MEKVFGSGVGCEISFWPRIVLPFRSSAPSATRTFSSSTMLGTTTLSAGARLIRAYSRIAASILRKNMRAPAKKKFPTDPFTKSNLTSVLAALTCEWKYSRKLRMMSA